MLSKKILSLHFSLPLPGHRRAPCPTPWWFPSRCKDSCFPQVKLRRPFSAALSATKPAVGAEGMWPAGAVRGALVGGREIQQEIRQLRRAHTHGKKQAGAWLLALPLPRYAAAAAGLIPVSRYSSRSRTGRISLPNGSDAAPLKNSPFATSPRKAAAS